MEKIMIELDTNYYIQTDIRYKILVNYLKELLEEKEGYVNIITKEDIRKILKALGEVE